MFSRERRWEVGETGWEVGESIPSVHPLKEYVLAFDYEST
jgi:hypothetical protein